MLEPSHYWIVNVRIPNCFIDSEIIGQNLEAHLTTTLQRDRLFPCHLEIRNGQIAEILPSCRISEIPTESLPIIDGKQGIMIPCFADLHTHLDKGHIWAGWLLGG